jgi:hypothetical protein
VVVGMPGLQELTYMARKDTLPRLLRIGSGNDGNGNGNGDSKGYDDSDEDNDNDRDNGEDDGNNDDGNDDNGDADSEHDNDGYNNGDIGRRMLHPLFTCALHFVCTN